MPQKVKVTTDDGKSVIVTLDDEAAPSTPGTPKNPDTPEGAVSRFGSAALGALTSPIHFATALVTDPKGLYENLVNQSAEHFTKAAEEWKAKQYGPAIHRAIAGVIPPYGVVSEAADRMRAGDVAGGIGEAVGTGLTPKAVSAIPAVARAGARAAPAVGGAAVRAGAAAADLVSPDVVGVVSPRAGQILRVVQKLRDASAKPETSSTGAAPRLVKKGAPLSDQLQTVLEELQKEKPETGTAPAVPGAAQGGEQAATTSMRMLAEKPDLKTRFGRVMSQDEASPIYRATDFTKPTRVKVPASKVVATQEGFQNPIIEQYQLHPGEDLPSASKVGDEYILNDGHHRALAQLANGAQEIELNSHPVDMALAKNPQPRAMWLEQMHKPVATETGRPVMPGLSVAQERALERSGRTTPYTSEGSSGRPSPIPLSEAESAVRKAITVAKLKPTATQWDAAIKAAQSGRSVTDIVDGLEVLRQLKESSSMSGLMSDTEMGADLSQRGPLGGRIRNPKAKAGPKVAGKSPQQLLNEEAQARYRARKAAAEVASPF